MQPLAHLYYSYIIHFASILSLNHIGVYMYEYG